MGFFDIFRQPDINKGLVQFREEPHALLLDVRTPQEYASGHVPESMNVPVQTIDRIVSVAPDKAIPLYIYCHSGARSSQAAALLQRMGYYHVTNIGGIATYRGKLQK